MKKILMTGGTGFLGPYICASFLNSGYKLCLTVRSKSRYDNLKELGENISFINMEDDHWQDLLLEEAPDYILHMATNYGRGQETLEEVNNTNLVFPLKILDVILKMENKPVFLNVDTSLPSNVSPYALSKNHFLDWLKFYNRSLKVVNIVLENFYGPNDNQFISIMADKIKSNIPEINLTIGIQRRDFLYYDDVVSAFLKIVDNVEEFDDKFTEFEIGSGRSYSIKEVIKIMTNLTGNNTTQLNWGAVKLRENEIMDSTGKISKICSLGWAPTIDLEEGIKKILEGLPSDKN